MCGFTMRRRLLAMAWSGSLALWRTCKSEKRPMGSVVEYAGEKEFLELWTLMGGTFHQDFDINGSTLEKIIGSFKQETAPEIWAQTKSDIERFLAEGPNDKLLVEDFERMFAPQVITEGWDGMTTRQWLTRVAELLQ